MKSSEKQIQQIEKSIQTVIKLKNVFNQIKSFAVKTWKAFQYGENSMDLITFIKDIKRFDKAKPG